MVKAPARCSLCGGHRLDVPLWYTDYAEPVCDRSPCSNFQIQLLRLERNAMAAREGKPARVYETLRIRPLGEKEER